VNSALYALFAAMKEL